MDIEKLSADAVIFQLNSALAVAKEYIAYQDKRISELQVLSDLKNNKASDVGLVSAEKAAVLLNLKSKSSVYEMMNKHILPEVRVCSRRMVHIDDINQYISNQRRKVI